MTRPSPPEVRFWKYVTYCPNTGCWLWTGATTPAGYGKLLLPKNKQIIASRLSFAMHRGELNNLFVCHHCDTPACVNPDHLFLGTASDNMRDCFAKKRQSRRGIRNSRARLTEQDVFAIRNSGMKPKQLLKIYPHISRPAIEGVLYRRTWRHLP